MRANKNKPRDELYQVGVYLTTEEKRMLDRVKSEWQESQGLKLTNSGALKLALRRLVDERTINKV